MLPGSKAWPIVELVPGQRPLEALTLAVSTAPELRAGRLEIEAFERELIAHPTRLLDPSRALHRFSERVCRALERPQLLVVVDQLEEVFGAEVDEKERRLFLDNLGVAAAESRGLVTVVIAVRADFVDQIARYGRFASTVSANAVLVGPMEAHEVRSAILRPAMLAGGQIDAGLIEVLLEAVRRSPAALPLLQHVLKVLWDTEGGPGRALTMSGYERAGGLDGAVAKHAERVFTVLLSPEQQRAAPSFFRRLIRPGEDGRDTKRRIHVERLPEDHVMRSLVTTLSSEEARLVVIGESRAGRAVELSHEALIEHWPRLRAWTEENRDAIRVHNRIARSADDWIKSNRSEDFLYTGALLATAKDWISSHRQDANQVEWEFISASTKVDERRRKAERARHRREQMTRISLVVILVLTVPILALGVGWIDDFLDRREALRNRDGARATEATAWRALADYADAVEDLHDGLEGLTTPGVSLLDEARHEHLTEFILRLNRTRQVLLKGRAEWLERLEQGGPRKSFEETTKLVEFALEDLHD
ncbi:MAG: hypothetical protein AAFU79_28545, partial [Myxococcota bacterium]